MKVNYNELFPLTQNLTVLYIEDDLNFREETLDIFDDIFKNVDTAADGYEGLQSYNAYFEKNSKYYDIVITDINMPKLNGIELTKEIYLINENQSIIVISAHNETEYLLELINLGIERFLMKPLDYDLIMLVLYNTAKKLLKNDKVDVDLNTITINDEFTYSLDTSRLFYNNEVVKLTKNETQLMNLFLKKKDKICTIEEISATLFQDTSDTLAVDSLKPIISRLRKKLPENIIENIYGLGYRLVL